MNTTSWVAVVVVVLVAGGAWWYVSQQSAAPAAQTTTTSNTNTTGTDQGIPDAGVLTAPVTTVVTYGPNGFSPSTVTIAKGGTVTFTAAAGADEMWVASAPHPAHTGYDGTDRATHCAAGYTGAKPFDQCSAGTSFSFTFDKTGTWPYHNHGHSSDFGTVVVQ